MTANELYQIVKTEIETRIAFWDAREKNATEEGQYKDTCTSRVTELTDLLAKLNDKMSVSGQSVADVETAADIYRDNQTPVEYPNYFTEDQIREAFIAGNDWRMAQLADTIQEVDNNAFKNGELNAMLDGVEMWLAKDKYGILALFTEKPTIDSSHGWLRGGKRYEIYDIFHYTKFYALQDKMATYDAIKVRLSIKEVNV